MTASIKGRGQEAIGKNTERIKNDKGVHTFERHILRINSCLFPFRVCIIINTCLALETQHDQTIHYLSAHSGRYSYYILVHPTYAYSTKAHYVQNASTGIKTLNSNWYSQDTGLWDGAWWQSANALTTLADFAILQPGAANSLGIANTIQNTVKNAPKKFPGFINTFYDDEGWCRVC